MSTLYITRGLPGSGKSTYAREWVAEDPHNRARVNRDDIRAMLHEKVEYTFDREKRVTAIQRNAAYQHLKAGLDVICDDTNLRLRWVREWRRWAVAQGFGFEVIDFDIDPLVAIARDSARVKPVGEDVISDMASKYLTNGRLPVVPPEQEHDEDIIDVYQPDQTLPEAIIVDIDGTVALHNGRDPYDLSKVGEDLVNVPVALAVDLAHAAGYAIVYCSGREESSRADTVQWINDNKLPWTGHLYMRPWNDKRRDAIVKRELFDRFIRPKWHVRWVYDDRQQVVNMWRSLGLTCMQVARGDF